MRTDYLVVGAGTSGLAFADSLTAAAPEVDVTLVDRRRHVGGHWRDTYPFVRLHTPSSYYGVDSLPLGEDRVCDDGFYERAGAEELKAYFQLVAQRLAATGRVRLLTGHEHLGPDSGEGSETVRNLETGALEHIAVSRKVVDARYLEASVPATHEPSFEVDAAADVVPVGELPAAARPGALYTVLGAGKTAVDACTWLLDNDVDPERIRWVRPREMWFHDRAQFQPLAQVGALMEGIAQDAEAAARASDLEDLQLKLEESGRLLRIDTSVPAEMYRGTMLDGAELRSVREIGDVVRLGRARRVEPDRIVLERGEVAAEPGTIHVDCTAVGLRSAPPRPVFEPDRIVLQQVRHNSPSFNAALIGRIEARGGEAGEKNRLCPPNPFPSSIGDYPRMITDTWRAERRWLGDPEVSGWVAQTRLNLLGALPDHIGEPQAADAVGRFVSNVGEAAQRAKRIGGQASLAGQMSR
ncbi:NAD(P)-binding protein [Thermoleophilia bacterium SCSIO 60948]|nr:NAD(P)-binding protein [Thermoleophilia bacterium SCSIO 60948]